MIPFSRSPSRIPGWLGFLRTVAVPGSDDLMTLPSPSVTLTAGIAGGAPAVEPARISAAPSTLLAITTATAPAASAFCTFCRKGQVPRSTSATVPAGKATSGPQPSLGFAPPSSTRTIGPAVPALVAGGPNRAQLAPISPTPSRTTWFCGPNWLPGQRNICIRGVPASAAGVEKLALLVPAPSAASQRT
jgi:hypothetical protein